MKAYVITTGIVFALLTVAHVARMFTEHHGVAEHGWYIAITAATAALSVWAFVALRRARP
ncbi:MAG TPA: hypothetical protein VF092_11925 [Longimicrobium sp.]